MTDALGEALQLLQSTLSEKTVTLTERAQAEVQLRTENIGNILRRYRTVLEGCSAADLAVELLKETDKAMFVQAAKPLVGRLVETARSLKQTEEMCDNYETFDDFTLDSANALKDLRELDFVRLPGQPVLLPNSTASPFSLEWTPSTEGGAVDTYAVEYAKVGNVTDESLERPNSLPLQSNGHREVNGNDEWTTVTDVTECRFELPDLEMNSSYRIRVRACNRAGTKSSDCVIVKTPPAQGDYDMMKLAI